jgi:clan AA aspartic protease
MRKRSIGKEIVAGLKEIKAWKRGAKKLRGFSVELPRAAITLRNPCNMALAPLAADAIVDTRTRHLCIPEHVAIRLKLEHLEEREVTTVDGVKRLCAYVGPIEVQFGNRGCFTGALVLGDEILLGSMPMDDMDLVVSPATRSVTVNPANPNVPSSTAKQIGTPSQSRFAEIG